MFHQIELKPYEATAFDFRVNDFLGTLALSVVGGPVEVSVHAFD